MSSPLPLGIKEKILERREEVQMKGFLGRMCPSRCRALGERCSPEELSPAGLLHLSSPRSPCATEGSARGTPRLLLTPAAPDSSRPLKYGCCTPGAWSCCPTRGDGGDKNPFLLGRSRGGSNPSATRGGGTEPRQPPGRLRSGVRGCPNRSPSPAPRSLRSQPRLRASPAGSLPLQPPRGVLSLGVLSRGATTSPVPCKGYPVEGAQRLSPLLSPPPRRPAPARGGTGEAPAAPTAPLRSAPRWAPLRSAALGSAQPFPVRLRRRTQRTGCAPPRVGRLRGAGAGTALPGDARGCSVLPAAAHPAHASRCFPVLPGAARCCPVMLEGARCCPSCCAPPALPAPRCHRSFPRLWVLQPPPRRAPGRAGPGFCSSDRCWHGEGCPKPASSVPRVCSRSWFLMVLVVVERAQHPQGHWEGGDRVTATLSPHWNSCHTKCMKSPRLSGCQECLCPRILHLATQGEGRQLPAGLGEVGEDQPRLWGLRMEAGARAVQVVPATACPAAVTQ